MEKRALGKGLNQLMGGQAVAGRPSAPAPAAVPASPVTSDSKVTPVDFGRGLTTLVAARPAEKEAPEKARLLLPAWFFFTADLLLLAYTVAICLDAGGPLEAGEIAFAAVSTTLGVALGILGVLRVAENNPAKDGA